MLLICIECVDEICRELRWSLADLSDNGLLIKSSSSRFSSQLLSQLLSFLEGRWLKLPRQAVTLTKQWWYYSVVKYTAVILVWLHTSSCRGSAKFFSRNCFYVSLASRSTHLSRKEELDCRGVGIWCRKTSLNLRRSSGTDLVARRFCTKKLSAKTRVFANSRWKRTALWQEKTRLSHIE